MSRIRWAIPIGMALAALLPLPCRSAPTALAGARAAHEQRRQRIDATFEAAVRKALQEYSKALAAAMGAAQRRGDLDDYLALKNEKERLDRDPNHAGEDLTDVAPVLQPLRSAFVGMIRQAAERRDRSIAELLRKSLEGLRSLQKSYVVAGRMEEAIEVKAEVKQAEAALAEVTSRLGTAETAEAAQTAKLQPRLPPNLTKGLVLHYSFDKNERGKVSDLSGSGNHGTVHGAKWVSKGLSGGAYKFDGKRDYIDTENPSLAEGFREVTLSVWIRLSAHTPHSGIVCSRPAGPFSVSALLSLSEGAPVRNDAVFFVGNGEVCSGSTTAPGGALGTTAWQHLAATWKSKEAGGDGMTRIYLDGKLSDSHWHLEGTVAQRESLKIGWDSFDLVSGENRHFNGLVDDVRVYKRALGPHEVADLCQLFSPPDTSQPTDRVRPRR